MAGSRCILVLAVGRSGSSALAGALHQAGVSMGPDAELIGPHAEFNPKGHFEWRPWWELSKMVRNAYAGKESLRHDTSERFRNLLARRIAGNPAIFGIKDVYAPWSLPYWWEHLPQDTRVVVLHRSINGRAQSIMRHDNGGKGCDTATALRIAENGYVKLAEAVGTLGGTVPRIHVQFEALSDSPSAVAQAVRWCYEGLDVRLNGAQVDAAVQWIEPRLRHW